MYYVKTDNYVHERQKLIRTSEPIWKSKKLPDVCLLIVLVGNCIISYGQDLLGSLWIKTVKPIIERR